MQVERLKETETHNTDKHHRIIKSLNYKMIKLRIIIIIKSVQIVRTELNADYMCDLCAI